MSAPAARDRGTGPPHDASARARSTALFALTAVLVIAGAVATMTGSQATWERATVVGRTIQSDEGPFRFPDRTQTFDADDLGARTTPLAGALLAVALLPLLAGPRARPILYALAAGLAIAVLWSTTGVGPPDAPGEVRPGAGRLVVRAGAALVLAASVVAIGPSAAVPRLRMPERAPE